MNWSLFAKTAIGMGTFVKKKNKHVHVLSVLKVNLFNLSLHAQMSA